MYKECVSKHAIARQREIEQGLLKYMTYKPYENITVIDLCQQLSIPRKAFYRYFSNKDGALYALIDHTMLELLDMYLKNKSRYADNQEIMTSFFNFWLERKSLLNALDSNNLSGVLLQRAISFTMNNDDVVKLIAPPQETERAKKYITIFLISGIFSLVIQWHHNHFDKSPRQMAKLAVDLLPQ